MGSQPDNLIATYRYDAFNRRVEKTSPVLPDRTTRYVYDGWRAIEERAVVDVAGTDKEVVRARFGFGLGLDEVVWMDRDVNTADAPVVDSRFFLAHDALGSVVAATDDRTVMTQPLVVRERYTYSAYGKMSVWAGAWSSSTDSYSSPLGASAIGMPYTYTGQRFDPESGLYYYKNRYFDAKSGRFLTRDPLGSAIGPNLYRYARGRPHVFVDSLGLYESWSQQIVKRDAQRNNAAVLQGLDRFAFNEWLGTSFAASVTISTSTSPEGDITATSVDEFSAVEVPDYIEVDGQLVQVGSHWQWSAESDVTITADVGAVPLSPFGSFSTDLPLNLGSPVETPGTAPERAPAGRQWVKNTKSVLDVIGMFPGVGVVPDIASAVVSFAAGDVGEGCFSLACAVPFYGDGLRAGRMVAGGASRFVRHHTVPREILKQLPGDIANNPLVRGRAGAPNRWRIPEDLHKLIHRGRGGGLYNELFKQRIMALNRPPTAEDILRIRDELMDEFGLGGFRP